MKAIIYKTYGPPSVVVLAEVPKPAPREHEVLVRIHATTVTTGDWRARSLEMPPGFGLAARFFFGVFGPRKPILGTELAGEIVAIGRSVTKFKVGDQVFAFTGASYGCHAEYRTIPESGLIALKPSCLSFEEAAAMSFGGMNALGFLRSGGGVKPGDKVLIVGASGGVGTAAVQIAKHFGAEVTGVCSTANLDLVLAIGADKVIDYGKDDFAASGETYDIILDTTATSPFSRCEHILKAGGRLLVVQGSFGQVLGMERPSKASAKKVITRAAAACVEDVRYLAKLAENGEFRPVIDRRYPLEDAAAAHAYVDKGRKKGNVILTIERAG